MTQVEFAFDARKKMTIMERFSMFHEKNPHVYTTLVEMARKASKNGTKQCSIAMLFEVLRWRTNIETERIDEFKISNCLRAPYARHIMYQNPDLKDIFNLKTSETDEHFEDFPA
jgi:hypothetical protein